MTDAASSSRCPTCAAVLASGESGTWCLRCALATVMQDVEPGEEKLPAEGMLFQVSGHAVLAELGRGAVGIVYRAHQRQPPRDVALKILRPHEAGSAASRARFRAEAETVAAMDHPGILPVYTVGETDGLPFFTMKLCVQTLAERVNGYIARWREIAGLMVEVAGAVGHAHSRGVLHRDLKPGNILFDEADRVFVGDFGVAKTETGVTSGITQPMHVFGTPGYMAPEILTRGAIAAAVTSDVFGLGAVLYELLSGSPPAGADVTLPPLAGVPRDLALICTQSLRTDPATRYQSVEAFESDLRAWLAGRPIAARPVSAFGHVAAWARRNPALAGVSLTAVLLLGTVAVVATQSAVRLGREQRATARALQQATTEAATSKAIADFLQDDLLAQASPDQQPDRDLKLRTVLDRAAKKIDGRFGGMPAVEAALRDTLAETYRSLGEYELTEHNLERVVEIRRAQAGAEAPATLEAQERLAGVRLSRGKVKEAEALVRQTLAQQRQALGPEHPQTLRSLETLGDVLIWAGRLAEAEEVYARTLEIEKRVLGPEHPRTLAVMVGLGEALANEEQYDRSEAIQLQVLAIRRRIFGLDNRDTLESMNHLAVLYLHAGRYPEAAAVGRQTIEIQTRLLGPEHPDILTEKHDLAVSYLFQGNFAEAETLERAVVAGKRKTLGPNHAITIHSMRILALALVFGGKADEGEALLREAIDICRRNFGPDNHETLNVMNTLGFVYQHEGRIGEAEDWLRQVVGLEESTHQLESPLALLASATLGQVLLEKERFSESEAVLRPALERSARLYPNEWKTAFCQSLLGEALVGEKRFAEAEPLLLASFASLRARASSIPVTADVSFRHTGESLIGLYRGWGKLSEAEAWRQKLAGSNP